MTKFAFDRDGFSAAMRQGMINGGNAVQLFASKLIRSRLSRRGTGRRYRVAQGRAGGRNLRARGIHIASAPGQPPAPLNGYLRASFTITAKGGVMQSDSPDTRFSFTQTSTRVAMSFGTALKYARFLEFGTARMKQRPFVRPVMMVVEKDVREMIRDEISREINRYRRSGLFRPNAT